MVAHESEELDACCARCGSMFHATEGHETTPLTALAEFPPGYDPAEADRLIGRDPDAQNAQR